MANTILLEKRRHFPEFADLVDNVKTARVVVVIPTYNEAENVSLIAKALMNLHIPGLQVVFVDDNSPDGTGQVAERIKSEIPGKIHVLHRNNKEGLGCAYLTGFEFALEQDADFIIQMDADFSHSPSYIPKFLSYADQYDLIIGSRYTRGGKTDPRWSWLRYLLSWFANSLYVRTILGTNIKDATGGFKCWSRQALQTVLDQNIISSGYIFQVEMNYLAEKLGFRILEIPIYFEDRRSGSSKMSFRVKAEAALRTWALRWRYRGINKNKLNPEN